MSLFLLLACTNPPLGTEYKGQRIPVTDMHLHTGEWESIASRSQNFFAEIFPFPFNLDPEPVTESILSAEGVLEEMDSGGFSRSFLFAVYAPRSVGVTTNEWVIEQIEKAPERLYGLASLSVENWSVEKDEQLQKLAQALEHPSMIGVKLAHPHQFFRMDDAAYYSIYEVAAEYNAPVYLHTGPSPFVGTNQEEPYINPNYLEEAISTHPDTKFILGHLGFDFINKKQKWLDDCLRLAETYPNVWLEPSALGSEASDPDQVVLVEAYRKIKEKDLIERVIYGSDGPQRPGFIAEYLERNLYAMEQNDYTIEEVKMVLSENADRAFGLPSLSLD